MGVLGGDRGSGDRANARNGNQPVQYVVLASTPRDLFVKSRVPVIDAGEQIQHQTEHGVGGFGKRTDHLFFLDQIGKPCHV